MRILMISPYPPSRDGIGSYAVQEVRALHAAGHDVEVLSPTPSAAQHSLDLAAVPRGPLALAKRVRSYDRVLVQFHPDIFLSRAATPGERAEQLLAMSAAFTAAKRVEVRVHEFPHHPPSRWSAEGAAWRAMWRCVDAITVHTPTERRQFAEAFGVREARVTLVEHGRAFTPAVHMTREQARSELQLSEDALVFLSIGFLQPHKGFDRSIAAFDDAGLGYRGAEIHVVGSVRTTEPDHRAHVQRLHALAAATPGAHVHEGYVSDRLFDTWLIASDVVVLPYRVIWSSSVVERAAMHGRPVVASRVGGLIDQAPAGSVLVGDDHELALALARCADDRGLPSVLATLAEAPREPWRLDPDAGAATVQAEVVRRARAAAVRRRAKDVSSASRRG